VLAPSDLQDEEQVDLIISNPFPLPRGVLAILGGQGETGKSFLTLYLASQWAKQGVKTLYFSLEDSLVFTKKRLIYLAKHTALPREIFSNLVLYRVKPQPIIDQYSLQLTSFGRKFEFYLRSQVKLLRPDVIVIDPIAFLLIKENDNAYAAAVMDVFNSILEEANVTIILLHHLNKLAREADGEGVNNIRGASALTDHSRFVIEARRLSFYATRSRRKLLAKICENAKIPQISSEKTARQWILVKNTKSSHLPAHFLPFLVRLFPAPDPLNNNDESIVIKPMSHYLEALLEELEEENNGGKSNAKKRKQY